MQRLSVDPIVKIFAILIMIMAMISGIAMFSFLLDTSKKMFKNNNHKVRKRCGLKRNILNQ